jgi:hypothetical protein
LSGKLKSKKGLKLHQKGFDSERDCLKQKGSARNIESSQPKAEMDSLALVLISESSGYKNTPVTVRRTNRINRKKPPKVPLNKKL